MAKTDFVIRFANVNGSGSASANGIVARTLFRMGIHIGPKNMFPSNIQGSPTWFELRVSDKPYTARRENADILVAMNPGSLASDLKRVNPGGYVIYDSTAFLPEELKRADLHFLPIPMAHMAVAEFSQSRKRILLQNLIYVGALAALIQLDREVLTQVIEERYGRKATDDYKALELGLACAQRHFECPLEFQVEKKNSQDRILIEGNYAMALGCLYAGASIVGWYPITPSTGLIEHFSALCERYRKNDETNEKRYAIVQAEDEMTALGIVVGASWNGCRAFTATSGPGLSLMNEFLGYAYYAEIPAVLFDVQRAGPATGLPTRTQQADLLLAAYASHGDTKHVLLFPANPEEGFRMAVQAFDLAERFQTPVIVMSDLELGMNEYESPPFSWDPSYRHDRGKIIARKQRGKPFYRYTDEDGDGIAYRSFPGVDPGLAYFTRGSGHDAFGRYTEDAEAYAENLSRIVKKFATAAEALPTPIHTEKKHKSHPACVVYIGTSHEAMHEALDLLSEKGITIDSMRLRAFPFSKSVEASLANYETLLILDQNRDGQLKKLLCAELNLRNKLHSLTFFDGLPLLVEKLCLAIEKVLG